jgi:hypothetical protein
MPAMTARSSTWNALPAVVVVAAAACTPATKPPETGPAAPPSAASTSLPAPAPASAVTTIPIPARAETIELDFTGSGLRPWLSLRADPPALARPLDEALSDQALEPTAVAGTRKVTPISLGPLRAQLVTAELLDRFCRPHFARADDAARGAVLTIFACSEGPPGDAAVRAALAAFGVDGSPAPSPPAATRRITIGPYSMAVPDHLLLTYVAATAGTEESVTAKLVQRPCLTPGSRTWDDEFLAYSQSQWQVTTRTTQHAGREVLRAELDEKSSANATNRLVHKACSSGPGGTSLQIELSSSPAGALTVRFDDLVSVALALALPPTGK